jgi:uncharacterized protein (TIGR03000 family)
MSITPQRIRFGFLAAGLILLVGAPLQSQEKEKAEKAEKGEKQPAIIELLVPEAYRGTEVKFEGEVTKQKGEKRTFKSPPLEPGKTYVYKIEVTIEPNNYTKIIRVRDVQVKAGETVKLDLRNKDDKIPDDVRIRWVPTPDDIVEQMAKIAKIGKDDIVYDLGCGDGIMLCIAVKKFGAKKGVGIDIDKEKVKMANDKKKEFGVEDKVEIREGNILKLDKKDIGDCSVMMLYLGDEMLSRLRPMLLENLKPGTRIVSHRFVMGDEWKPDQTITVTGTDGDEYTLHLWTVPEPKKDGKKEEKKDELKKEEKK